MYKIFCIKFHTSNHIMTWFLVNQDVELPRQLRGGLQKAFKKSQQAAVHILVEHEAVVAPPHLLTQLLAAAHVPAVQPLSNSVTQD